MNLYFIPHTEYIQTWIQIFCQFIYSDIKCVTCILSYIVGSTTSV